MEIQVQDAKEIRLIYLDTRVDANSSRLVTAWSRVCMALRPNACGPSVTRQRRYTLSSLLHQGSLNKALLLRLKTPVAKKEQPLVGCSINSLIGQNIKLFTIGSNSLLYPWLGVTRYGVVARSER